MRIPTIQKEMDTRSGQVQQIFGIDYAVMFPEGYSLSNGKLMSVGKPVSDVFVVSQYINHATSGEECLIKLKFLSGHTIDVSSDDLGDPRRLAQMFNRHQQAVDNRKTKTIAAYISDF
jgi:hypothetical protein